ncbi:hypothetical protein AAES_166058 [Amazona aestiva]|uniref:Uncharacterized protein n=1 Tax=Amazona aestiva TaxID=12930 RepID=A0A0Q3LT42_AMAAE|nr:hypothetical protein AAES_166058 [Amazona aestiva]
MDVDVDLNLAVRLLFTVLAFFLASVFVRLWGAEGQRPQESCPVDQEEGKEAATEQQEEVEKPSREA